MARILVVDDSPVDRLVVGRLLARDTQLEVEYAEHGSAALIQIEKRIPELVITDLQMPYMDGLQLVSTLRAKYSDVPVILITAHGSEALAIEALERGAPSYVPKLQMADKLLDTVKELLALSRADRNYARLVECTTVTEFGFELDNDAALIDTVVDLAQQLIINLGDDAVRLRVGVALEQALLNAFYQGNLEIDAAHMPNLHDNLATSAGHALIEQRRSQLPYRNRKAFVRLSVSRDEARCVVRDEGPGIDISQVPEPRAVADLGEVGGRGLLLMRTFMDEVRFNASGNEVTLVKRREPSPMPAKLTTDDGLRRS